MNVKYKGIIFDFNGVLLWDSAIQERVWLNFAEQLRGTPLSVQEVEEHLHGRVNKHTLEYVLQRKLGKEEVHDLAMQKESMYREECLRWNEFVLSPGAVELLDFLKQNNIPHTIATASEITNLRFFFEKLSLDKWFDIDKVVYDDGKIPGKPAPDIYLKAAEKLGLAAKDCVVVEDAVSGIAAANAAGIGYIAGLLYDENNREKYARLPGVKTTISSLKEVRKELFAM